MTRMVGMLLGLALALLSADAASADTYTVNSTADAVDATPGNGTCATAGGVCTLRAAVQEANAHAGADVISLPAGLYVIGLSGAGENVAATGDLDVTEDLQVNGAGAADTIIDGAYLDRIFDAYDALTLRDVTLRHGQDPAIGGALAVTVNTSTTVERVEFRDNTAGSTGGGAIFQVDGNLTITDSTFARNTTSATGGAVYLAGTGALSLTNSTFTTNSAPTTAGGGVFAVNTGATTVTNCTLIQNVSDAGGGMYLAGFSTFTISGSRFEGNVGISAFGGLFAASGGGSSITATGLSVFGNVSAAFGGVYLTGDSVQVSGGEYSDNVGTSAFGGAFVSAMTSATVDGTVFRRNAGGSAPGGGLYVTLAGAGALTIMNVEASENAGSVGGGISATSGGTVALTRTHAFNNGSGVGPGGGVYLVGGGSVAVTESTINDNVSAAPGGGLFVSSGASLTLDGSTVSGNRALGAGGLGGGVYLAVGAASVLVNSTFSGNTADLQGGGLLTSGDLTIRNSTFVDNDAPMGSAIYNGAGTVTPISTIIAGAALSHCAGTALTSGGNNIDSTGTCGLVGPGDQVVDPQLGPLADNGGSTLTHLPAATSPALDAGAATGCPATDQRGQTRPTDGNGDGTPACDVGAVEFLDLCLADPAKVLPGICGCGVADTDANFANGTADCLINGEMKARIARAKTIIGSLAGDADPLEAELGTIGESLPTYVSQFKAQLQLTDPKAKIDKLAKKASKKLKKVGKVKAGKKLDKAKTKANAALDALDAVVAPQA